ncbi:Adenylyltransferase and sulfurtransferase UBA4 [Ogataea parapolymorpha DL-1]|uniref:Adenylyltransferase and sulfurtransferase uba4 n=1 Tax=Ogataea parapolymorpha (strain ATCC 26012 / BCRC 20466 / JCM 22074 / NRRL Y-7560 / DL-1) TaxID=871575 RepID=UBA4_OGAPD|nr:Adenylyltransferase and sulfurtransferase UBA4 [Ogataea parapolymorpha DL-1]ESX00063.1 Adenylyltransferase and sulfurtransferase UBA4 [Ogataea parapolymorpha DL-1]
MSLSLNEYLRYGRQLIVPEFGLQGQISLKNSRVLVVGAGGLGCPALQYLVGAGFGTVGIVDHDTVDISNLHRQILHTSETVEMLKCESAKLQLAKLNPLVQINTHPVALSPDNSFGIFEQYDIILDCTDTPATRYLINDTAVLLGLTVISGSGLKTEGQLSILNFNNTGPCYRCFYPTPPPPSSVTACSDGGVLGPVIGIMGVMMALEAIKVVSGYYLREDVEFQPFLSLYSGYGPLQSLRTFKMRRRSPKCRVCNAGTREITRHVIETELDYAVWCGKMDYNVLEKDERVSVEQLSAQRAPYLVDVRAKEQYSIVHLPNSINIPLNALKHMDTLDVPKETMIYVICRFGNDSQLAVKHLKSIGYENCVDVIGGLTQWSRQIDPNFPIY